MASIHKDPRTGNWIIMFRWGKKQFRRSTETASKAEARAVEARLEETIRLLKAGRLSLPDEVCDVGLWLISEGKLHEKPEFPTKKLSRVGEICDAYLADQIDKSDATLEGENTHVRHLKRVLRESRRLGEVTLETLQEYVNTRVEESYRGRSVSGKTVRKELGTLRQVWQWAQDRSYVGRDCPIYDRAKRWAVSVPKVAERPKFQTWKQIERRIARGGLTPQQEQELWSVLFLDEDQIVDLLDYVKKHARYRFIHPMFVFAAYTGARQAEIRRSQIDDLDFDSSQIKIRERKRRKDMAQTYRIVPMHQRLRIVMEQWFAEHPGGPHTIAPPARMPRRSTRSTYQELTADEAHHHFKHTLHKGRWKVIRGFHVLRHSFGSNLARSGRVPRETIAKWMGHTTQEMMDLYQHLFPEDAHAQIDVLK